MNQLTPPPPLHLTNRAVLSVIGSDSLSFLERLLTNSLQGMRPGSTRYAALLTPQGMVLSDMFVTAQKDGVRLDVPRSEADELIARLNVFRLRADVKIAENPDEAIALFVPGAAPDPREESLPPRCILPLSECGGMTSDDNPYHRARLAAAIPEFGCDYRKAHVYPFDVNLDLQGGIDFDKGCFVGQEVVSRMKRRGTARRRTLLLTFAERAPIAGSDVLAGGTRIGEITSGLGTMALARLRIDRAAESGWQAISSAGMPAHVRPLADK